MNLLIDMNLSHDWGPLLASRGWDAKHWSEVGPGNAPDVQLMQWARARDYIVLTQDLDFSQILFNTGASGPSVVLLRMNNEFDPAARQHVLRALKQAETMLLTGALLTISGQRVRIRRLPITGGG